MRRTIGCILNMILRHVAIASKRITASERSDFKTKVKKDDVIIKYCIDHPSTSKETIHRFLRESQFEKEKQMEYLYKKFGIRIKAKMEITFLLILILSGCISMEPAYIREKRDSLTTSTSTVTTTSQIITTSTIIQIKTVVEKITQIIYVYENRTIDLTKLQKAKALNYIPDNCYTASCSDGAWKCKKFFLDILGLKPLTPFKESQSTGARDYYSVHPSMVSEICLPVYDNNFTKYVELSKEFWQVTENDSKIRITKI